MAHIQKRTRKDHSGRRVTVWRARYRAPDAKEHSKTFLRRVDAERFLTSVENAKLRGEWTDPRLGRTPFGEWAARVVEARAGRRESTIARDESLMRSLVLPTFETLPLAAIDAQGVKAWVAKLTTAEKAPATVRKACQLLASVLDEAVDVGMLPRSPCRNIPLPRLEAAEIRFLTAEQVGTLADAIDPRYRALVLTGAYTGLRIGELAALRTSRLDLLHRSLRVEETVNEVRGHLVFGPPKTRASRRTVSLPTFLVEVLAAHLAAYPPGPEGLVFTSPEGQPLRRNAFRRRHFIPALQKAEIGEWTEDAKGRPHFKPGARIHDLRHSHAALLIAENVHPKVLQERLGHASIRTTLDTYGHLFEGLDEAAADALDGAFREALAASTRPRAASGGLTLAR